VDFLDRISLFALLSVYGDSRLADSLSAKPLSEHIDPATLRVEEIAWTALAAGALARYDQDLQLKVGSAIHVGALQRTFSENELKAQPIVITNPADHSVFLSIERVGRPVGSPQSVAAGFTLKRSYLQPDGKPIDKHHVRQFDRIVVGLTASWPADAVIAGPIKLVDEIPAGFEFEPLAQRGQVAPDLSVVGVTAKPRWEDAGATDFVSLVDAPPADQKTISAGYVARAVTPGLFTARPASIVDADQPKRLGRTASEQIEILPAPQ
jgi:alpha-2-macroglobulin